MARVFLAQSLAKVMLLRLSKEPATRLAQQPFGKR